jgi:hypothetical protein
VVAVAVIATLFQEGDLLVGVGRLSVLMGTELVWSCGPWPSLGTPIFVRSAGDGRPLMRMFAKGLVRSLLGGWDNGQF